MKIHLIRHAQSRLNAREITYEEMPNHAVPITDVGVGQSQSLGKELGPELFRESLLYCSPYTRTRQTMANLLIGAGLTNKEVKVYEDPRLREIDHGYNYPESQKPYREKEGWFWYRFDGGESPADCYDRSASFISSMSRQLNRKPGPGGSPRDVVIVSHGMMVMTFVMRYLHLTVEQFETLGVPPNCSLVTIGPKELIDNPQFTTGKWAVSGLKLR